MLLRREPSWIVERAQVQIDFVGRMVVLVGQGTAAVAAEAADHGWRGAIAGALRPAPAYRVPGKGHESRHRTAAVPTTAFAVAQIGRQRFPFGCKPDRATQAMSGRRWLRAHARQASRSWIPTGVPLPGPTCAPNPPAGVAKPI